MNTQKDYFDSTKDAKVKFYIFMIVEFGMSNMSISWNKLLVTIDIFPRHAQSQFSSFNHVMYNFVTMIKQVKAHYNVLL